MNTLAAEGWQYLRSDTLPNDERSGLTSMQTTFRSVLVFRRPLAVAQVQPPEAPVAQIPPPAETPFMPQVVASAPQGGEESDLSEMDNVLPIALLQRARQVATDDKPDVAAKKSDVAAE